MSCPCSNAVSGKVPPEAAVVCNIAIESAGFTGGVQNSDTIASAAFPVAAGQLIAVFVGWEVSQTVQSVMDTVGNVYFPGPVSDNNDGSPNVFAQWWWTLSAGANPGNVVTVTFTAAVDFSNLVRYVLSGVNLTSPIEDIVIADPGSVHFGVDVSTVPAAASDGNMLLAGYYAFDAETTTWATPSAEDFDAVGGNTSTAHQIVFAGNYAASATITALADWAATMMSVRSC